MQNFFLEIVEITFGMSLLILLMLLVLRVIGGKFTAKCRYILWTLVLIRLAVPFGFGILPALIEVPVEPVTEVRTEVQSTITVPAPEYILPQIPQGTAVQQQPIQTPVPTPVPEVPEPAEHQPEVVWEQLLYFLSAAYLTGAALFLFWNLLSYTFYTGKILRAGREPDEHTMGIYTSVCRANQLRHIPHLIISPHVNSPAAFGIIRRRIVLPNIGFNDNALAGTLMHEVTHCKRGDLYIKAAALLARSLHWFNPLVHLAAFRCEMEMELSCDESVLAGCSDETRAAYGESMLDIIRRCRQNRGALTTHFNPKKTAVKARLQNILYGSGKRRGTVLIVLCLVMCLIAGTIVACQVEGISEESPQEEDLQNSEPENDMPNDLQPSEHDGFELVEFPYTDKVFPRPAHWNSEQIGEIRIVSNTIPVFSFQLFEWNTYTAHSQLRDNNGLVWELEAYTHESYEIKTEEFHETDYLIGVDEEYTYILSLPADMPDIENDPIHLAHYSRLREESQAVIELFMSINGITPNPDCPPINYTYSTAPAADPTDLYQNFLDAVVAPYTDYLTAMEYIDLDGNGINELILYSVGDNIDIFTIEYGKVRSFSTETNAVTHYGSPDEAKTLAPPSVHANQLAFWGVPTSHDIGWQNKQLWFRRCTGVNGHLLYSYNSNETKKSAAYYYFFSDPNGCLDVLSLSTYTMEAVNSNPALGWNCYVNGQPVTKQQYMNSMRELWDIMSVQYGVLYSEENTFADFDLLLETPGSTSEYLRDVLHTFNTHLPMVYLSRNSSNMFHVWDSAYVTQCLNTLTSSYTFEPLTAMEVQEGTPITLTPTDGIWTIEVWENSDYLSLYTGGETYFYRASPTITAPSESVGTYLCIAHLCRAFEETLLTGEDYISVFLADGYTVKEENGMLLLNHRNPELADTILSNPDWVRQDFRCLGLEQVGAEQYRIFFQMDVSNTANDNFTALSYCAELIRESGILKLGEIDLG